MGLFSGGIILRKKRQIVQKISLFKAQLLNDGNNITDFGQNSIFQLKRDLRESMNRIAETLDENTKNKLIEESKIVFELNNETIKSVQIGSPVFEKILYFIQSSFTGSLYLNNRLQYPLQIYYTLINAN